MFVLEQPLIDGPMALYNEVGIKTYFDLAASSDVLAFGVDYDFF